MTGSGNLVMSELVGSVITIRTPPGNCVHHFSLRKYGDYRNIGFADETPRIGSAGRGSALINAGWITGLLDEVAVINRFAIIQIGARMNGIDVGHQIRALAGRQDKGLYAEPGKR